MTTTVLSETQHVWLWYLSETHEISKEVASEDPEHHSRNLPHTCTCFSYYRTLDATLEVDGKAVRVKSADTGFRRSKLFWIDGQLLTPREVTSAEQPDTLRLEIHSSDWMKQYGDEKIIVKDRVGQYHFFEENYQQIIPTH